MIRKILLVSILILLITGMGLAFQNEPDGFRGLKWGDEPTRDMVFLGQIIYEGNRYYREDDKLNIGSAKLDYIFYTFNLYSNQFYKASLYFTGKTNYNILKIIFEGRFGKPIWKEKDGYFLQWMGEIEPHKTRIYLNFDSKKRWGYLLIVSEEINRETPKDNKQKEVEKAKEDF